MRRGLDEKSDNKFSLSTPAVKATSTWRLQPLFNSGPRRSLLATIRFLAAPPASSSWRWQRVTRFLQVIASVTWFGLAAGLATAGKVRTEWGSLGTVAGLFPKA